MARMNDIDAGTALKDKALYLCFSEPNGGVKTTPPALFIGAISLSDILSPSFTSSSSCCCDSNLIRPVARISSDGDGDLPKVAGCGLFGSKIIFHDVVNKYMPGWVTSYQNYNTLLVFETDPWLDPDQKIQKDCFPSFVNVRRPTLIQQLDDGKLYAFESSYHSYGKGISMDFDVFDRRQGKWSAPPPEYPGDEQRFMFQMSCLPPCFATEGTNIFLFADSESVLHRFDVAAQDQGWTKHCTVDPLLSSSWGRALILNSGDDGFVMFTYADSLRDSIHVYHMSKEYGDLRHVESHQLPDRDHLPRSLEGCWANKYSFVHLGGEQVCFVLAIQMYHSKGRNCDDPDCSIVGDKMTFVLAIFEYALTRKSTKKTEKKRKEREQAPKSESIGQFNFLGTRVIQFDMNWHQQPDKTLFADMIGAFVVPPFPVSDQNIVEDTQIPMSIGALERMAGRIEEQFERGKGRVRTFQIWKSVSDC